MEWAIAVGACAIGLVVGVAVGPTLRRARRSAAAASEGSPAIDSVDDARPGLGRRSLDSLRVGVVVLDADDVPVLVNPSARGMGLLRAGPGAGVAAGPGPGPGAGAGAGAGKIVAHPIVRTLAGQVRRSGVRREVELDMPRGESGTIDPIGLHLRAVHIGGGVVAVEAVDVTESHRVARVRRDFVANVSHELKTPIGALQLLSEALLDATEPVPSGGVDPAEDVAAARRFAERIQHESTRLGRLVNELLELTRLQGAEPLPEPEPVAVDWVVAEVIDRTRTTAAARQIEVEVSGDRGLTVYGSGTQVATAVANLVENAIAYSKEERTRVTITTRSDEDHVEIAVTDQGIGIAPHEVDRIFERFYRADQARSRATGGTGLGLAIVKHIATNHGGQVDVTSTLGAGSTFTLRLPASPPEAAMPLPAPIEMSEAS